MKKGGLIVVFLLLCVFSKAQTNDALLWTGAAVKFEITKDIRLDYEFQTRFYKNVSTLSQVYNELSLKYEPFKGFDVSGSYRYSRKNKESNFIGENRLCLNASYGYRLDFGLKFDTRIRYQHAFERLKAINNSILPNARSSFRWKATISYKNKDFKRVQPYINTEWFSAINPKSEYGATDAYRFGGGLDFDLPAKSELQLGYIFEKEFGSTEQNNHIYIIQYTYNIPVRLIDKKRKKTKG